MADLRKSLDTILMKWGWDILLQRRINTDSDRKQFKSAVERHTVRGTFPGASVGLTGITQEQEQGTVHDADMVYYFRFNANPREGDRIYDDAERTSDDVRRYTIDWVTPMRGIHGRIEFWTVGATLEKD